MKELKPVDYDIICGLIKNSRLSDRQLAKSLGVSQPTVTRRRAALEKERLFAYTAVPNMKKLGFEILAFTFASSKQAIQVNNRLQDIKTFLSKHPNIVFVSTGHGSNFDRVCISFHKTYSDYVKFMRELKTGWLKHMDPIESFIVSLRTDNILRDLTFQYLADCMRKARKIVKRPQKASEMKLSHFPSKST